MSKKFFQVLFVATAFSAFINGKGEATCDSKNCATYYDAFKKCCKESKPPNPSACDEFYTLWGTAGRLPFSTRMCDMWTKK